MLNSPSNRKGWCIWTTVFVSRGRGFWLYYIYSRNSVFISSFLFQFLFLPFSCISATRLPKLMSLVSFSLLFFLYFDNTNTKFYPSSHLTKKLRHFQKKKKKKTKKLCTIYIKLINSNFNNI